MTGPRSHSLYPGLDTSHPWFSPCLCGFLINVVTRRCFPEGHLGTSPWLDLQGPEEARGAGSAEA